MHKESNSISVSGSSNSSNSISISNNSGISSISSNIGICNIKSMNSTVVWVVLEVLVETVAIVVSAVLAVWISIQSRGFQIWSNVKIPPMGREVTLWSIKGIFTLF